MCHTTSVFVESFSPLQQQQSPNNTSANDTSDHLNPYDGEANSSFMSDFDDDGVATGSVPVAVASKGHSFKALITLHYSTIAKHTIFKDSKGPTFHNVTDAKEEITVSEEVIMAWLAPRTVELRYVMMMTRSPFLQNSNKIERIFNSYIYIYISFDNIPITYT